MKDNQPVLIVDLDNTLLRTDLLFETFWSTVASNWHLFFLCLLNLFKGRAFFKQFLASSSSIDFSVLPYDKMIIQKVRKWSENGGRTLLVTASDVSLANKVQDHLKIFDEVYGSDGKINLKGKAKVNFIQGLNLKAGYTYIGDSISDLHVWKDASGVITVNASNSLRRKVNSLEYPHSVEHLKTGKESIAKYFKVLRPYQWSKNILVFLPMLAAHQFDLMTFQLSFLTFLTFNLIASAVYVLNDLLDLSADRAHNRKCKRPFASGDVPLSSALWLIPLLLTSGFLLSGIVGGSLPAILAAYLIITSIYSFKLKRLIVIDICVLSWLYTMRIISGGIASEINVSVWLLGFSIFFFFSLAAVKRLSELAEVSNKNQKFLVGRSYNVNDLQVLSQIAVAAGFISVLILALYINSPAVLELYSFSPSIWGVCLVTLFWITRTIILANRGTIHDDPVVFALKDRVSLFCGFLILGFAFFGATI